MIDISLLSKEGMKKEKRKKKNPPTLFEKWRGSDGRSLVGVSKLYERQSSSALKKSNPLTSYKNKVNCKLPAYECAYC